jgi:hypothetical protein
VLADFLGDIFVFLLVEVLFPLKGIHQFLGFVALLLKLEGLLFHVLVLSL